MNQSREAEESPRRENGVCSVVVTAGERDEVGGGVEVGACESGESRHQPKRHEQLLPLSRRPGHSSIVWYWCVCVCVCVCARAACVLGILEASLS